MPDLLKFRLWEGRTCYDFYEFQNAYERLNHKLRVEFSVTYSLSAIDENIGAANVFHGLPGSIAFAKKTQTSLKQSIFFKTVYSSSQEPFSRRD